MRSFLKTAVVFWVIFITGASAAATECFGGKELAGRLEKSFALSEIEVGAGSFAATGKSAMAAGGVAANRAEFRSNVLYLTVRQIMQGRSDG